MFVHDPERACRQTCWTGTAQKPSVSHHRAQHRLQRACTEVLDQPWCCVFWCWHLFPLLSQWQMHNATPSKPAAGGTTRHFPLPVRVMCSPRKVNLPPHFQVPGLFIHAELPLNFIPAPPRLPLHSPGPQEAFQERKWQTLSLFPAPPRCTTGLQGSLHPTRAAPSTSRSVISSFAKSANRGLNDSKQHALPFRIHEACFPLRYQLASGCVQELHCHTLPSNWLLVLMKITDGRGLHLQQQRKPS